MTPSPPRGPSAERTAIDGLWAITTNVAEDERGAVRELFRLSAFAQLGVTVPQRWEQVNLTRTRHGALRGMHGEQMTKLVGVSDGAALGAYLDTRGDSSSRGKVVTLDLVPGRMVLVPPGVCNGFQAVSVDGCSYVYCLSSEWVAGMSGIAVNPLDPALAIGWPVTVDPSDRSMISAKDAAAPPWSDG